MKTHRLLIVLCGVLILGCNGKEEQLQKQISQLQGEQTSLQQSIAERDQNLEEVMRAVNEVYADLEKARAKEGKLAARVGGNETNGQMTSAISRQQLLNNINEIGSALKENRKRIASLQSRIKSFNGQVASLTKLVDNLKQTLQEREQSIALLETKVQGLETTVAEKTKAIAEKENIIDEQQRSLNTAYMVVGTRKELEEKGIITDEGGFLWGLLGSTTIMASGVDRSLFTPIDRTKDQSISVQGKIDEVLPHRSELFFATAQPVENSSVLTITQPDQFWQDRYLVIVVD
jgi:predicted  nucleic acid-binding Zn-ribbon protein